MVSVGRLVLRPVSAGQLRCAATGGFAVRVEWVPVSGAGGGRWTVPVAGRGPWSAGPAGPGGERGSGARVDVYEGLAELVAAGEPVPEVVLAATGSGGGDMAGDSAVAGGEDVPERRSPRWWAVLELVQAWLAAERVAVRCWWW